MFALSPPCRYPSALTLVYEVTPLRWSFALCEFLPPCSLADSRRPENVIGKLPLIAKPCIAAYALVMSVLHQLDIRVTSMLLLAFHNQSVTVTSVFVRAAHQHMRRKCKAKVSC